jgi:hypothetical protein
MLLVSSYVLHFENGKKYMQRVSHFSVDLAQRWSQIYAVHSQGIRWLLTAHTLGLLFLDIYLILYDIWCDEILTS